MGNVTRAAWWLIAAGACREAVERLGGLAVEEARAAATAGDLAWARSGDGGGFGDGDGGVGDGGVGDGGVGDGDGGVGDGDGIGCGDIYGGRGGGYGSGSGGGGGGYGAGPSDIISITIDGEALTPAEARERVRKWAT